MSPSKRGIPEIARPVLQTASRIREQAAWELLYAIEELYPERIQELRALGGGLPEYINDGHDWMDEASARYKPAWHAFRGAVENWAAKNRISCEAVHEAAARLARGARGPTDCHYVDPDYKGEDLEDGVPIIFVEPHKESRREFLDRCAKTYDELVVRFGGSPRTVKRELEHFKFLAAHLVGGKPFAVIADNPAQFHIVADALSAKTVAGEARKTADLIDLQLPKTPGPRRGSRLRSPANRVR